MLKGLKNNAEMIGLLTSGGFAALILSYVLLEMTDVPVFFIWFGWACIVIDGLTLYSLVSVNTKSKGKKKSKKKGKK